MSNIFTKKDYLSPSRYISGRIIEYDIKAANISCLRSCNRITEEEYQYYSGLPKKQREIEIGLIKQVDPTLYTDEQIKITEAKQWLAQVNNISESQVVRIANDAVYIDSMYDLKYLEYDNYIRFVPKSLTNLYVNLCKILFFISFENDNVKLDIKNVGDEALAPNYNYIISELLSMILILERSSPADALNYISRFVESYVNLELNENYYRELVTGKFRVKNFNVYGTYYDNMNFMVDNITANDKGVIDINTNYNIIRELWNIALEKYNMRK